MELGKLSKTINEFSGYLQAEKGLAPETVSVYKTVVARFIRVCATRSQDLFLPPDWDWEHLDKRVLESYIHSLRVEEGWRPATIIHHAGVLNRFFRFLFLRGAILRNPARHLDIPPPGPTGPLPQGSEEAVRQMFALPPAGLDEARVQLLLELMYGGGVRPSGVYGLQEVFPQPDGQTLRLVWQDHTVDIPLAPEGMHRVAAYLSLRKDCLERLGKSVLAGRGEPPPFWVSVKGKKVGSGGLAKQVRLAMESAGLSGGGSALRLLSAGHFKDRGADVRSVKTFLGQKRLSLLDRYDNQDYQQVAARLRQIHPRQQITSDPSPPQDRKK
ncbi:MAG: phage integrase N-terminal SAM-like domain-containing protein [Deltaproteobacteria bacterium]|nr:phage integrase N-terminal SAM-like domain-containing protein [Deltaproteobacteria bacterium]